MTQTSGPANRHLTPAKRTEFPSGATHAAREINDQENQEDQAHGAATHDRTADVEAATAEQKQKNKN
jgi:hypothetical protein